MWSRKAVAQDLEKRLSSYRYQHSIRTMELAIKLANYYQLEEEKVALCALAHDVAKELSEEENRSLIIKYQLPVFLLEKDHKGLLHAILGAYIVVERYGFTKEMADSVLYHVTGRKHMTLLEKIVYLADKTEPSKDYEQIEQERKLSFINIDQAVFLCMKMRITNRRRKHKTLHPMSLEAYDWLQEKVKSF